jgi:hypothetical protein
MATTLMKPLPLTYGRCTVGMGESEWINSGDASDSQKIHNHEMH